MDTWIYVDVGNGTMGGTAGPDDGGMNREVNKLINSGR